MQFDSYQLTSSANITVSKRQLKMPAFEILDDDFELEMAALPQLQLSRQSPFVPVASQEIFKPISIDTQQVNTNTGSSRV